MILLEKRQSFPCYCCNRRPGHKARFIDWYVRNDFNLCEDCIKKGLETIKEAKEKDNAIT